MSKLTALAALASISAAVIALPAIAQNSMPNSMPMKDTMKPAPAMKATDAMKPADTMMKMNGAETMKGAKFVRITFENLTTGQPFSPGVFLTHAAKSNLFKVGEKASDMIVPIAEGGNIGALSVAAAKGLTGDFGAAAAVIHTLPGQTRVVDIAIDQTHPLLSGVWMLGNTNDGFSGIADFDAWSLKAPKVIEVLGYDAGSEKNSEKKGFLGALGGGNDRDPENGVVTVHTGIRGDADAPKDWSWDVSKPVARITIAPVTVRAGS